MSSRFLLIFAALLAFVQVPSACGQTPLKDPPITASVRVHWLVKENVGAGSLMVDVALAGIKTATNSPEEYGPHWTGYGQRVGLIAANHGVKTTMEAGLGSLWGEDPRYFRTEGLPVKARLVHVILSTFTARNENGRTYPAYARFAAVPGSNFLANQWMPDSQATANQALVRTGLNFLSRMSGNAWKEFFARKH